MYFLKARPLPDTTVSACLLIHRKMFFLPDTPWPWDAGERGFTSIIPWWWNRQLL